MVASISVVISIVVGLRGVGNHWAVVNIVADPVAVFVHERVNADDFVLIVVDVVEVAIWPDFKAHDGRGRGLNFVEVSSNLPVGGQVVGDDVAVAVFRNKEFAVAKGNSGRTVEARSQDAPFNAVDPGVFGQGFKSRWIVHDVRGGVRAVIGVHPKNTVRGWIGNVENTRIFVEHHVPREAQDVGDLDV